MNHLNLYPLFYVVTYNTRYVISNHISIYGETQHIAAVTLLLILAPRYITFDTIVIKSGTGPNGDAALIRCKREKS